MKIRSPFQVKPAQLLPVRDAGSFSATKDRAAGSVYVVVSVEQHAEDFVGVLIDIVEVAPAETGLVANGAEAVGRDLTGKGHFVLV